MTAIATAYVAVKPDMKSFPGDVRKGVDQTDVDGQGKKAGSKFGGAFGVAAGAAAAVGLVAFGRSSIGAFKEAEAAQIRLSDAFAKFPALADVSKKSLTDYNEVLATKTRFDDDALASGQAVLAQFGLTGAQVTELTPLLADYAAKTGTDLPTAAGQLGKAVLGQGRALKNVGVDFVDTGTAAGNLEQITEGLRTQVGGFAEKEGKTAAGQSEILRNRFGELQESVGGALIPILQGLTVAGIATIAWMEDNKPIVIGLSVAFGALGVVLLAVKIATLAQAAATAVATFATSAWAAATWVLNAALAVLTSPITAVILGVAALAAGIIYAYKHSETFRITVSLAWKAIQEAASFAWNSVIKPIFEAFRQGIQDIGTAFGIAKGELDVAWSGMKTAAKAAWDYLSRYVVEPLKSGIDGIASVIDTITDGFNTVKSIVGKINPFGGGGAGGLQSAGVSTGARSFPLPGGKSAYPVTQGLHPVNAIDYGARQGTPVYASFSGFLQTADLGNSSYGKYYQLSGSGRPIRGAHLSAFARASGPISQGTLIGWTGNTGHSTGPHFHLENFDWGGLLWPGWNVVRNDTGKMERVAPVKSSGGNITVTIHAGSVIHERDLVRSIRDGLNRMGRRGDMLPA